MILVHDVTVSASCPLPGTVDYCVDHVWPGVWTMCVNVNVNVNVTPVSHAIDFCPLSKLIKSLSKSIKTSK